jgi:hypothetical protein
MHNMDLTRRDGANARGCDGPVRWCEGAKVQGKEGAKAPRSTGPADRTVALRTIAPSHSLCNVSKGDP